MRTRLLADLRAFVAGQARATAVLVRTAISSSGTASAKLVVAHAAAAVTVSNARLPPWRAAFVTGAAGLAVTRLTCSGAASVVVVFQ